MNRPGLELLAGLADRALLLPLLLLGLLLGAAAQAADVGKWEREVISLSNASYAGNPFELEVDATFTHVASGATIVLPGYYAGNDVWQIGFMPTRTGQWTWSTSSPDPELDDKTGSIFCVDSELAGMLTADPGHPRKWKYTDGPYAVPVALRMEIFSEPATLSAFTSTASFLANQGVHLLETRLLEETGQFGGRHDFIFSGPWQNHQLDLQVWDRMEQRMQVLTQRGLGAHVMFYSDDAGRPGWAGRSATEALVIRYVVARLAGFPNVWFNTGIDIAEYRSQQDIDWWGSRLRSLDPYDHPISSRRGGGSGSIVLANRTFDSWGDQRAEIATMTTRFQGSSVPVSMDDAWGENRPSHPSKNHTPADIRRAFWKALVAGGVGGLVRGSNGYFSISSVQSDWESEQWVKRVNPFLHEHLGDTFGAMVPAPSLVTNAHAIADPGRSKILVLAVGREDTYDGEGDRSVTSRLRDAASRWLERVIPGDAGGREPENAGTGQPDFLIRLPESMVFDSLWFDPRTGASQPAGIVGGADEQRMTPPTDDDWLLLLRRQGSSGGPTVCEASDTTLCLNEERFAVEVEWTDADAGSREARAEPLTADTGYYWFFEPDNVEILLKVLDGCAVNDRHWVFATGLTDLPVRIHVSDAASGLAATYSNPGGPFPPVLDTETFATCRP